MKTSHAVLLASMLALASVPAAQEQPRFTAGVEVTSVDVAVVDQRGNPLTDLKPDEFVVRVDNRQRRIVTAEWVSATLTPEPGAPTPTVPEGYSSNEGETSGRLIIIAVDEANLHFGGGRAALAAAARFVDALKPTDRIAAVSLGVGGTGSSFTADHERIKAALARMTGRADVARLSERRLSLTEATRIADGDPVTLDRVVARECTGLSPMEVQACVADVRQDAATTATQNREQGAQLVRGLRALFGALRTIDAPKTLVLLSNGFVTDNVNLDVPDLAAAAATARTTLYALRLDRSFVEMADQRAPIDALGDDYERSLGLEMLASASRGAIFQVVGSGDAIFKRIEGELAGYYVIGVESDPRDRDGRSHPVKVEVTRRGTTVRARRQFIAAPPSGAPQQADQALASALASPLPVTGLPIRAITFALQGPEAGKVQLLIHAEVGNGYTEPTAVSAGFFLTDSAGRVVDTRLSKATLSPTVPGMPSPVVYVAGASVPPGEYSVKIAAADGLRAGSVEHPVHAALPASDVASTSDLIVGSSINARPELRPVISSVAWYGTMQAYLEVYGPGADGAKVRFEVASDDRSPALTAVDGQSRRAGDARTIFAAVAPVTMIPAGAYRMRAMVSLSDGRTKTLSRAFSVPPRAPHSTVTLDAASGEPSAASTALFLPVGDADVARRFDLDAMIAAPVVASFLDQWLPDPPPSPATQGYLKAARAGTLKTVPPEPPDDDAFGWFVRGLAFLQQKKHEAAENSFKRAMSDLTDTTVPLVYLGAAYAASGHDHEAGAAWVTALATNDELPEIFQWAADAFLRVHDVPQARSVLEEAAERWPSDVRFARPLAMLYAELGRGRDAFAQLERHLVAHADDKDALKLAVRWLFELHAAGISAHDDDAARVKQYAAAYEKLGGGDIPLVRQWVDFVAREKP